MNTSDEEEHIESKHWGRTKKSYRGKSRYRVQSAKCKEQKAGKLRMAFVKVGDGRASIITFHH